MFATSNAKRAFWRATLIVTTIGLYSIFLLDQRQKLESTAPWASSGWEKWADDELALATALYWEAAPRESVEGLRAIAWVIKNRVSSHEFPDSIREVVIQGYKGQKNGGCQFSFVCNGAGESPREFVRLMRKMGVRMTVVEAEARWRKYSRLAADFIKNPGCDPTGGANHYWAVTMRDPYWKADLDPASIKKIGSHWFGWSRYMGNDVPRAPPCT